MRAIQRRPPGYKGAEPLGLHLEGPMLNKKKRGAHPAEHLRAPSPELVANWTRDQGVAMVTLAPELPGAPQVIERLADNGVVVSAGHTEATEDEAVKAVEAGTTAVTHIFNAMSPLHHRRRNLISVALTNPSLTAGLIADGVHVSPAVVDLTWRAKGPDHLLLVTDAVAAMGAGPGDYPLGETPVNSNADGARGPDGQLVGSITPMIEAVRNLASFTTASKNQALRCASATPSRLLGLSDRGEIQTGQTADIVLLDGQTEVAITICRGRSLLHRRQPPMESEQPARQRREQMEVIIKQTADQVAQVTADIVERLLDKSPNPVLGLATGGTPLPAYRELVRRHRAGQITFKHARAFLLDEYAGLPPDHPSANLRFIRKELTDHIDLPPSALTGPHSDPNTLRSGPDAYDAAIRAAGGIDLQLLGIGTDGHIGFNEPGSSLASRTRIKTLAKSTRRDNARFFEGGAEAVPRHVITQGIGTILEARHLVLVATGAAKAAPIAAAVEGPLTSMVPASALQLHTRTTAVVDTAAAGELRLAEYYLRGTTAQTQPGNTHDKCFNAHPPWEAEPIDQPFGRGL